MYKSPAHSCAQAFSSDELVRVIATSQASL